MIEDKTWNRYIFFFFFFSYLSIRNRSIRRTSSKKRCVSRCTDRKRAFDNAIQREGKKKKKSRITGCGWSQQYLFTNLLLIKFHCFHHCNLTGFFASIANSSYLQIDWWSLCDLYTFPTCHAFDRESHGSNIERVGNRVAVFWEFCK